MLWGLITSLFLFCRRLFGSGMAPEDPTLKASFLLLGSGRTFKRQVPVRGWYVKEAVPLGEMLELLSPHTCLPSLGKWTHSSYHGPSRISWLRTKNISLGGEINPSFFQVVCPMHFVAATEVKQEIDTKKWAPCRCCLCQSLWSGFTERS